MAQRHRTFTRGQRVSPDKVQRRGHTPARGGRRAPGRTKPIQLSILPTEKEFAAFWDQPPELIHSYLTQSFQPSRRRMRTLGTHVSHELRRHLASCRTRSEQSFLRLLSPKEIPVWRDRLAAWHQASPRARLEMTTDLLAQALRVGGPRIFSLDPAQYHLNALWQTIFRAPDIERRKHARKQWLRIVIAPLPNFRRSKDRLRATQALAIYENLRRECDAVIQERGDWTRKLLGQKLQERIARITPAEADQLAQGYLERKKTKVRDLLLTITGAQFQRGPHTVRSLMARARQARQLDRIGERGRRRYDAWLALRPQSSPDASKT